MSASMERVLEPEVMDHPDDASEYDAMDFDEPDARLARDALALVRSARAPRIVDLGTGTGSIPLLMLDQRADATVLGVDLATSMLALARRKAEARKMSDRLTLLLADVKATGLAAASFELVMSNSTVHHLPDPGALFLEVARLVRPGGGFVIRDLLRPASREAAWRTVERVAPNVSERQRQLFFDSLCAALTLDEVRELVRAAGLAAERIEVISDRHFTVERPAT
jgi:ubiquinone/menaquinone biosynthesis C-methylase UbiE